MIKILAEMTRAELEILARQVYVANVARDRADQNLLDTLSDHLSPVGADGKPGRNAREPVQMSEGELHKALTEWADAYNEKVLPTVQAVEQAVLGDD